MRATVEYARRKFAEFNETCFGGELPPLPIRMSRSRRNLGMFVHPRRHEGPRGRGECLLKISDCLDQSEEEVENTIIHEMIHYYIWYKNLRDSSSHGPLFRSIMADINRRQGRRITVSHRSSPEEEASDTRRRTNFVCVASLKDGRRGFVACARTRIWQINKDLGQSAMVGAVQWYVSDDPWFNSFPRARTTKLFMTGELADHLRGATPYVVDGDLFRPERPEDQ